MTDNASRPVFRSAAVALVFGLAGCGTPPIAADGRSLTLNDAGPPPVNPLGVISDVLRYRLKDPDSAKVELRKPARRVLFAKTALHNGGPGWELCPEVNAKNSFGAYTGYKRVFILWRAGAVVDFIDGALGDAYCNEKNDYRLQTGT